MVSFRPKILLNNSSSLSESLGFQQRTNPSGTQEGCFKFYCYSILPITALLRHTGSIKLGRKIAQTFGWFC